MYRLHRIFSATVIVVTFLAPAIKETKAHLEPMPLRPGLQQAIPLARFTSVEVHSGAKAVLQYGPVQRVTLLKGSLKISRVEIVAGERLVIDKYGKKYQEGYELEVEIVTPFIACILVGDSGRIESRGNFPRQAAINLAIANGGTIDARAIAANTITAAVNQGGSILAKPQTLLVASVDQGGVITYWGDARVKPSTQNGGQIVRGAKADADKPLSDFRPPLIDP